MSKSGMVEPSDLWAVTATWQQYQRIRLERLKQQRQRMQKMKQVVNQYSTIITDLENRNNFLMLENQKLKSMLNYSQVAYSQSENDYRYNNLLAQLQRQRRIRQNCQLKIQSLQKQIVEASLAKYPIINQNPNDVCSYEYQVLLGLYDQLKDEVYILYKQNSSLRQIIRDQSRLYCEKSKYSKLTQKQAKPGMIRSSNNLSKQTIKIPTQGKQNIKQSSCVPGSHTNIGKSTKGNQSSYKQKLKSLKQQNAKQCELIQKFQQNQKSQLQLIQLLKSQKSKRCLCHQHGKSSKNMIGPNSNSKLLSFKKDPVPN